MSSCVQAFRYSRAVSEKSNGYSTTYLVLRCQWRSLFDTLKHETVNDVVVSKLIVVVKARIAKIYREKKTRLGELNKIDGAIRTNWIIRIIPRGSLSTFTFHDAEMPGAGPPWGGIWNCSIFIIIVYSTRTTIERYGKMKDIPGKGVDRRRFVYTFTLNLYLFVKLGYLEKEEIESFFCKTNKQQKYREKNGKNHKQIKRQIG